MASPRSIAEDVRARLAGRGAFEAGPRPATSPSGSGDPGDLPAAAAQLGAAGLALATLVATDDEATADRDLKVRYVFEPAGGTPPLPDVFVTLLASLDPGRPELPSLSADVPAASWHEREAHDLFGIAFAGHPDPRPLVVHDGWPAGLHPLRKRFDARQRPPREPAEEFPHLVVEGEGVFEVPVGPIHAGIIEPGHFRFSTVGESVLNLEARLFYTHRGLEKRIEGLRARGRVLRRRADVRRVLGLARARVLRGERAARRRRGAAPRAASCARSPSSSSASTTTSATSATSRPGRATTTAPPRACA